MGRRLRRRARKFYVQVPMMDAALKFEHRMPTSKEMADFGSKRAAMEAGEKAMKLSAHLTRQGKTEDEIAEEIAKELSVDALLDAAQVMSEFVCQCIEGIYEVDLDEFTGSEEAGILKRGEEASWEPTEFECLDEKGEEIWKAWPDMTPEERVEGIVNRQMLFMPFMLHLTSGFGSVTVGKSGLRPHTEGAKTTS